MAVLFPFRQTADRLQQLAGQVAGHLIAARQRAGSAALLVRLSRRARHVHALAIDERAAEIAERARCGPVDLPLPLAPPGARRLTQRGAGRHARQGVGQRRAAGRQTWPRVLGRGCWLLVLLLGWGLVGGTLLSDPAGVSSPPVSSSRLVACAKPPGADPGVPCPHPLPGGSSTTQLGTCPSASSTPGSGIDTQLDSCTALSIVANTLAFYGVVAFGVLCLLWWLSTLVQVATSSERSRPAALSLVGRNTLLASFAFLAAWSLQAGYAQFEAILLVAQQEGGSVPLHTSVFLAETALVLVVRLAGGLILLRMLLRLLSGLFALSDGNPRALASSARDLAVMAGLVLLIALAPWVLSQATQQYARWAW